ncbi:nucleoside recognition protein [Thermodesulfatator indicus]
MKDSVNSAFKTALLIIKLIIPFYILADILIYFDILPKISFIFKPITFIMGLSPEVSLSVAAGILFNLYAAIAFAAPLGLTPYEWTILGLFLGITHSLPIENTIMKQLGISHIYSTILRLLTGILAILIIRILPLNIEGHTVKKTIELSNYQSFGDMIIASLTKASALAVKIIILVTVIIFVMDIIKKIILKKKSFSMSFSIFTGIFLGITYGAGILLKEKEKLNPQQLLFVGTFLMIAHALIEDPALFIIFGANPWILIGLRIILAIIVSYGAVQFYTR